MIVFGEAVESSGLWTATGSMTSVRVNHAATHLPNGKVLIAGGISLSAVLKSSERFDGGLGYRAAWQPQITSASFNATGRLVLGGRGFAGASPRQRSGHAAALSASGSQTWGNRGSRVCESK
jgi:hypothetical protein